MQGSVKSYEYKELGEGKTNSGLVCDWEKYGWMEK